jgi:hypothetical protein
MMKKKRHSPEEIAAKLHQADEMTAQGKRQGDIARSLGVSMMTYHRWRKARGPKPASLGTATVSILPRPTVEEALSEADRIREIQLENSRLRRLVTDLLLEKVRLEEILKLRSH